MTAASGIHRIQRFPGACWGSDATTCVNRARAPGHCYCCGSA